MQFDAVSPCTILVIEDDETTRDTVSAILEDEGHRVLAAANGDAALTCLRQTPTLPELILLDLRMPTVDGTQILLALRQHEHWRTIPVVLMSAVNDLADRAAQLGATAYLPKPFDLEALLAVVLDHCATRARDTD